METFDAIVIGLGAHGSGATRALARRGLRVLGIDSAPERGHALGSSGGRSRMIRRAYFEDPAYIPLLAAAWAAWADIEAEVGEPLIEITGALYGGDADSALLRGSVISAREQGLLHDVLDAAEIRRRWPIFTVSDSIGGLYDPGAGMIRPEHAISVQLTLAEVARASLRFGERVVDWRPAPGGSGLEVETDGGVYGADHLVIAAGAWTGSFVPDLRLPLEVERVPVFWFEPDIPAEDLSVGRLPMWMMDTGNDGIFYGFPYDEAGLKVSRHYSGDVVDPDHVDRTERRADVERVRTFMRRNMPAADGPLRASMVCLYANTPDHNFVIDVHPDVPGVAYASACSGHGFKFGPVVGEILADLALTGASSVPIESFRAARFAGR